MIGAHAVKYAPSRSKTSVPCKPTAIAINTLCASPPLSVAHSLSHMTSSRPHSLEIRKGSCVPSPCCACLSSECCELAISSECRVASFRVAREPNELIVERNLRGVPGRSDGRCGTYNTRVRYVGIVYLAGGLASKRIASKN